MKHQKDCKTVLVEFVSSLSDDELRYLGCRLIERYSDDLAEALNAMSRKSQVDVIFASARSADEVYQLCDVIKDIVTREAKKRKVNLLAVDF